MSAPAVDAAAIRRPSTWVPLHFFNLAMFRQVQELAVRDKRGMYAHMREGNPTPDLFFPEHGMSAGEFTVFKVLGENVRRGNTKPRSGGGSGAAAGAPLETM